MGTAALFQPRGAALHFEIRRRSGGCWQFSLWQGEKPVIPFVGVYRGPNGKQNCLAAVAIVQGTNVNTPIIEVLAT
jgi:uncharacterized protein YegP (UPF0339 family)